MNLLSIPSPQRIVATELSIRAGDLARITSFLAFCATLSLRTVILGMKLAQLPMIFEHFSFANFHCTFVTDR